MPHKIPLIDASLMIIAWPETLVRMIPRWYALPLQMAGIVRNGKIRAGHAAAALVDHHSGEILYTDFGRYMTPEGMGRTRTKFTDPEVVFPITAEIGLNGEILNMDAILLALAERPMITHGEGPLYASLASGIDREAAVGFMHQMNRAGSLFYDPFDKQGSNCARYVYDLARIGLEPLARERKLVKNSLITPSPLGTVMFGADGPVWRVEGGRIETFTAPARRSVLGNFFKKPQIAEFQQSNLPRHDPHADDHFLAGTGAQGYFRVTDASTDLQKLVVRRTDLDSRIIFEHGFVASNGTPDHLGDAKIVHDSNALWVSIAHQGRIYRYDAV